MGSPRSPRPLDQIRPFRTPFLHGTEGAGFERIVRHAARMMGSDDCTVAMLLTHVGESLANALVSGQLVRWPGVFVAGPYKAENRHGECRVWPRFQACPPLSRYVNEGCAPELTRNREMDAHRRRSRRAGVQDVAQVMESIRHAIVNQDLRALKIIGDHWRYESAAHAV